jgi:hypothetical protein
MKALWFLPLAFIAGEHGFAFFAPYLAVFGAVVALLQMRKARVVLATVAVSKQ